MRAINRGSTAFQRSLGDETGGMDPMETEPKPSDRKVLAGLVERVTYQNADNVFCVFGLKARGHRDLVTVVGHEFPPASGSLPPATG
jgi:exodeoxyribonuclease V alpha subunit